MFDAVQIRDRLWWVGALDQDLRVFDVIMRCERGTSYNSYVVKGDKGVAVLEAAKAEFGKEWVERICSVVDPKEITAIVCDHTEPDHAGALYELLNSRLVAGRHTVISSNLSIEEAARRYSPQIASRLEGEYHVLHFFGDDIRLLKKNRL